MAREQGNLACPIRTCVGCRERAAKQELLRVVASGSGHGASVTPDPQGSAPGRGAYVHPRPDCVELASRRRAFSRALRSGEGLAVGPLRDYVEQHAQQN